MTPSLLRNSDDARPSARKRFSKLLKDTERCWDTLSKREYAPRIAEHSPNESQCLPDCAPSIINRAMLIRALEYSLCP